MRNPYQQHISEAAHGADPLELVLMLYSGARNSVSAARRHLHEGDIPARVRELSKAMEIILELGNSVDRNRGGELADRLVHLYAYMLDRLAEANIQQIEEPLAEVDNLLRTLEEAWKAIQADGSAPAYPTRYEMARPSAAA